MAFTLAQKKIAAGTAARPSFSRRCAVVPRAAITLKDPPFALDALEGKGMSKSTLEYHWGECLAPVEHLELHSADVDVLLAA
jgi:hypothetical protein